MTSRKPTNSAIIPQYRPHEKKSYCRHQVISTINLATAYHRKTPKKPKHRRQIRTQGTRQAKRRATIETSTQAHKDTSTQAQRHTGKQAYKHTITQEYKQILRTARAWRLSQAWPRRRRTRAKTISFKLQWRRKINRQRSQQQAQNNEYYGASLQRSHVPSYWHKSESRNGDTSREQVENIQARRTMQPKLSTTHNMKTTARFLKQQNQEKSC